MNPLKQLGNVKDFNSIHPQHYLSLFDRWIASEARRPLVLKVFQRLRFKVRFARASSLSRGRNNEVASYIGFATKSMHPHVIALQIQTNHNQTCIITCRCTNRICDLLNTQMSIEKIIKRLPLDGLNNSLANKCKWNWKHSWWMSLFSCK